MTDDDVCLTIWWQCGAEMSGIWSRRGGSRLEKRRPADWHRRLARDRLRARIFRGYPSIR